jgi:hypothetical protein
VASYFPVCFAYQKYIWSRHSHERECLLENWKVRLIESGTQRDILCDLSGSIRRIESADMVIQSLPPCGVRRPPALMDVNSKDGSIANKCH